MARSKKTTSWRDFLNDFGDTIGGFLVGVGFAEHSLAPCLIGLTMIITSIYLEYFKKGKEDSN